MAFSNISVCITAYNQEKYIKLAIESVLNQTLLPYELLIIDDHSTDRTKSIIMDYSLNYNIIRAIYNEANQGITRIRNIALQKAQGDFLTFLDGDDYFLPDKLKEESSLISQGNFDFVYSNFNIIDKDGEIIHSWMNNDFFLGSQDIFVKTFSFDFPKRVVFRSELVNLKKWKEVGFFDENLEIWEDFEMRVRLTKQLKGIYNPHISHVYRRYNESLSSSKIKLYPSSFDYIIKKNGSLLNDINKKEKKRILRLFNELISNSYIFFATNIVSNEVLSFKKILLVINYILISQKYKLNIKSIFSIIYLFVKTRTSIVKN